MIKILLIEDNNEKRRLILEAAQEVPEINIDSFDIATNVKDAKKLIAKIRYDLVILDINLPLSDDKHSEVGAGLDVLRFIKVNNKAKIPSYLFGLTAFDDGAQAAEKEFSSPLWKLVRFSFSDDTWKTPFREALVYLNDSKKPPFYNDGTTYHIDLGIFAALEEELASILELDAGWRKVSVAHDSNDYFEGRFKSENGVLTVVATVAPNMGMPSAAVCASKLIHNFRPKYLAITGICAGVRGKSNFGDVLIADPCFDWGSGKWLRDGTDGELKFRPASYQWRLDETIRSDVKTCTTPEDILRIYNEFDGLKPEIVPKVIVDAMASGASVLQASELMNDVKLIHKNLVGVEMESYAVFTAAQLSAEPRPKCISIKAVCDFGDEDKGDNYHKFASYMSAQFLYLLALRTLVEEEY
ncbi:phosphorylase family protein [Rheinheimera fenheensis]|uniref:phosphorylase family protein n=1 Tax=Rheinheimera fenheensis TaxID=3152295 RepID=UPI00325EB83C